MVRSILTNKIKKKMKKIYQTPQVDVTEICNTSVISTSNKIPVSTTGVDGSKALSKEFDFEEDEEDLDW